MAEKRPKQPTDAAAKAKAISRWENEGGAVVPSKRPRDVNQWAKRIVDLATGEATESDPDAGKDPAAVALGRRGGIKGGKARAERLTDEERREAAKKAAAARWRR